MLRYGMILPLLFVAARAEEAPTHQPISAHCGAFYPHSASEKGLVGNAAIAFQVGPDGRAKGITLVQSSGITALDDAALTCVAASRYEVSAGERVWRENIGFFSRLPTVAFGRPHNCTRWRPKDVTASGIAELAFTVTTEGRAADARIAKSTGDAALDEASLRCAGAWRYMAAVKDGTPTAVSWKATIFWGDAPPLPVTGDSECWKALWPRAEEIEGSKRPTTLSLITTRAGSLHDLHVKTSSGSKALDDIALTCVSRHAIRGEIIVETPGDFRSQVNIDWHRKP